MRKVLLAVVALGALSCIDTSPAAARDYPFCIKGRDYPQVGGECSYPSYAACMAAASGRFAYCDINPFYQVDATRPRRGRVYREAY